MAISLSMAALLLLYSVTVTGHFHPGPSEPACLHEKNGPSYYHTSFSYPSTPTATTTYPKLTPTSKKYAVAYTDVSSLFANISSTTWNNWTPHFPVPSQTDAANPYGNSAFTALWQNAHPTNFSRGLYSTTVSPTPVPSSELVEPPPLYFTPSSCYEFPKDFIFGIAGSASQCEGAVADDGKAPSFMDMIGTIFSIIGSIGTAAGSLPGLGGEGANQGNYVALEHYYLYKQDIERFAAIGAKYYYFTIPWTRIMPFALPGTPVNSHALDHYDDMINFVLEKGMQPVVGLTHFDTPLQFFGGGGGKYLLSLAEQTTTASYGLGGISFGYQNSSFTDAFVHYSKIVMTRYADRVPLWNTFNEPQIGTSNGPAVKNVLSAHAQVYHYYKEVLNGTGKISIKMGITPAVPADSRNESHIQAANWFTDLYVNTLLYPLALGKDYPDAFKLSVADHVPLTAAELEYMNGTLDFTSMDSYSAPIVEAAVANMTACALNPKDPLHRFPICVNSTTSTIGEWSTGYSPFGSPTNYMAPHNLRTQLNYAWNTYKLPVFISEFGLSLPVPPGGRLQDNLYNQPQSEYLLSYLNEMLKAIWEDGVDVMGALVWNWADDWEFGSYDNGFGMQFNNFTTQERRYRRSFFDTIGFVEGRRQK